MHLELSQGIPALPASPECAGLFVVFWWQNIPLGHREIPTAQLPMPASQLATLVAQTITPAVGSLLLDHGFKGKLPIVSDNPARDLPPNFQSLMALKQPLTALQERFSAPVDRSVSVIVCTRDRPEQLEQCLRSLQGLAHPPHEIVVVDNAPTSEATQQLVAHLPGIRYVLEPRPGLSVARNTGIRHSTGEIIAFTDDDVLVHPDWIARLQQAFQTDTIMAVTGLMLPAELETEAQLIFHQGSGGPGWQYQPLMFDTQFFEDMKSRGVPVWRIGAGANMAFRREIFDRLGGFDERLGAGASGCSEDSEFWYRILEDGWLCRYDPTAVVFHYHRKELDSLKQQMYQYMRGHVTALLVQFARYQHWGNLRRLAIALPRYYTRRFLSRTLKGDIQSNKTLFAEISGCLAGLQFYLQHRQLTSDSAQVSASNPQAGSQNSSQLSALPPNQQSLKSININSRSIPVYKQPLTEFLARNPFPDPLTLGFFYREKMRAIHRIAPDLPFKQILEVGGGQGGLTALLYPQSHITNLDFNPQYAEAPCNQQEQVDFICEDATALPFEDQSFDAITMFDVLEHIPDHEKAIAEALRVLRPNGYLLISTPNENWRFPYYGMMKSICPSEADVMAEWGHVRRGYTLDELKPLLGLPCRSSATFINPITVLGHDVAFSRLSHRQRRWLCTLLSPLTWLSYFLHQPQTKGTETASAWQKKQQSSHLDPTEADPTNSLLICQ